MSTEDVRRALEAIDDAEVRGRVAGGDLSDLGDLSLDEAETALVRGAAGDYPEVAGFQFATLGMQPVAIDAASPYGQAVVYADVDAQRQRRRR
jgi:hypothetical protein